MLSKLATALVAPILFLPTSITESPSDNAVLRVEEYKPLDPIPNQLLMTDAECRFIAPAVVVYRRQGIDVYTSAPESVEFMKCWVSAIKPKASADIIWSGRANFYRLDGTQVTYGVNWTL